MADRFFQSKTAGEEANRRAMDQMAEGLRGDLGQVTASHSGLYRVLNEQSELITVAAADARAAKLAAESGHERIVSIAGQVSTQSKLLVFTLILNVVLIVMVALLLLHR